MLNAIKISLNIQINKIIFRSDSETTIRAYFLSERLSYSVIKTNSQKLSTLTIVKFKTSSGADITLQTSAKKLIAITMCSTFNRDCRYDHSILNLIGKVHCLNKIFWCTKSLSNLSAEATINVLNVCLCVRCAIFL